jgi:biotin---protein ligase
MCWYMLVRLWFLHSQSRLAHIFTGEGTTPTSIKHTFHSFRELLSPQYAVVPISSSALLNEPWQSSCVALIVPGGADLPFCRLLNGAGNRRIKSFVEKGGKYIGLCAGAYYASKRCEFMQGSKTMEVMGDRELGFFPGTCRGLAFNGFRYQSEDGAKAAKLAVNTGALKDSSNVSESCISYYNGGGVFVGADKMKDQDVEVLAHFVDKLDLSPDDGTAAVVLCKVGKGSALLTAPHPE